MLSYDLNSQVSGGLCDRTLGRSSVLLKMQGCSSWPGQYLDQNVARSQHSVIAQIAELKMMTVHGPNNILRQNFVAAFPETRTIDLRVQESNSNKGISPKTNLQQSLIPNTEKTRAAEADQDKSNKKLDLMRVRFQHNGTDVIKTRFGNMVTGNCSGSSTQGYDTSSLHIVSKLELFVVQIEVSQDFGYSDIPKCTKYPDGTNITIQNYVGVANSTLDREWLDMIRSSSYSDQIDNLQKCNPSCTKPLQYDNNGEGANVVEVFVAGQPNPVSPFSKNLIVRVPNSGKSHRSEVVIIGDFELPGGLSVSLPTHMPLLTLRDPLGGQSYSYYNNVKTHIRVTMRNFESYAKFEGGK
jgi:hypothetical protein